MDVEKTPRRINMSSLSSFSTPRLLSSSSHAPPQVSTHNVWRDERATWRLISDLYEERVKSEVDPGHAGAGVVGLGGSDGQIVETTLATSQRLRELRIVVAWLEQEAADVLAPHSLEDTDWRATLGTLRKHPGPARPAGLVQTMDPDAPIRPQGGAALHPDDADLDERLLRYLWDLARAGLLVSKGAEVCRVVGQAWRAASISGGGFFHDAIFAGQVSLASGSVEHAAPGGNMERLLWKQTALHLSREASSAHERALYGLLGGNVSAALPVCSSWADHVWVHARTGLYDALDEALARERPSALASLVPESMGGTRLRSGGSDPGLDDVFSSLISDRASPALRDEASSPFPLIQSLLISSQEDSVLCLLDEWTSEHSAEAERALSALPGTRSAARVTLLRFGASLTLFFRAIHVSHGHEAEQAGISLLRGYVAHLVASGQASLVARYTAHLPRSIQVPTYASFLEGVHETDERKACLDLAEEAGLDVLAITSRVVANIHAQDESTILPSAETDKEDEIKVRALEWLTFYPVQRTEALLRANALARRLLLSNVVQGRFGSTQDGSGLGEGGAPDAVAQLEIIPQNKLTITRSLLTTVLPRDTTAYIREKWLEQSSSGNEEGEGEVEEVSSHEVNGVHEYKCLIGYLETLASYESWNEILYQRPAPPSAPESARYADELLYEQEAREYLDAFDKWSFDLSEKTSELRSALRETLLFPNGWLCDLAESASGPPGSLTDTEPRSRQLTLLRAQCIPSLVFMLHRVLYDTEDYAAAIQVADLVADPHYDLCSSFTPQELQHLLRLVRLSTLRVVETEPSKDPLGYE